MPNFSVSIGSNSIEDIGAQALAEALSRNYSLATLLLRDNPLRDVGVKSLCQSLRNNRIKYLRFLLILSSSHSWD